MISIVTNYMFVALPSPGTADPLVQWTHPIEQALMRLSDVVSRSYCSVFCLP